MIEPLKQHVIQSPITDGATSAFTDRSEVLNKAMSGQFPDMSHVMTGLKTGMDLAEFRMHGGQQKIISGELPTKQQAFEMAKAELNSHTSDTSWTNTITHPISTAQKLLEGAKAGNAVLNTSTEKRAEISQTLHAYEESQLTKIGSGLVTSFATGQLLKTGGQALFALPHPAAKLVGGGLIASGHMMTVSGLANATYKLDSFGQQVSSLEQQHGGIKQAHAMVSDFNQQQSAPLEKDKMFEHMTQFGNFA
ncbi:hypothetical protein [Parachitinimonas caeni]|uniref:Uncharacterized protein n=1 Tax=Parachitinimonas caeni TaxID=3031301 RepID=A0ABT7DXE5_9NEIS|nr:hypothetical protein [Parachitinimonas caeni]MDK2123758.1 hypothetical protein [Parachitinimonas caeni]